MRHKPPILPDHELWDQVRRTIRPLNHRARPASREPAANVLVQPHFQSLPHAKANPPPLANFERRLLQKLARTQEPDSRIDLHGETLDSARMKLYHFLHAQHTQGRRLVLVITGKGSDEHGRTGRLRREVPFWLEESLFRHHVASVEQAHQRHGGGGALYVKLRRLR